MDQCEDTEEGVPPSKTPLCGDHESQTKGQRSEQNTRRHHAGPGPGPGPGPSCMSFKSDRSKGKLIDFKGAASSAKLVLQQRPASPGPSCVSMKSDWSIDRGIFFKDGHQSAAKGVNQQSSEDLRGPSVPQHQRHLDSIFMLLEENIVHFVKKELKKMQKVVSADYPGCFESQREDEEVLESEDEDERRSSRESFLKITLNFLRRMKQQELAERLQSRSCQHKLKSNLKKRFQCVFEGTAKAGKPSLLKQIYTELYITEGGTAEVNDEHEVRQIEAASRKADRPETTIRPEDIFKGSPGREEPIRRVLTKGVAGIGKTVLTQKLTLDWAEDKANQDIHFTFPFTFRELNVLKEKKFSLVELVHHFFTETKEAGICSFDHFQVLFIFDGLDECRLPLDFHKTEILTDVTESTSVDVLLTNLIRGKLLPSAHLWITTRPAAANHIPPQCVGMVTEVRGFTDPQKEEYFRKRFRDEEQTSRIISHMKTSRSLHIMCHIPVFCWITATVLEDEMKTREGGELPKTLTEMYIHFLVVQAKVKKVKYEGGAETDPHWSPETRKMIEYLGKLAFEQLQKGNLIFYESDLADCGIDIRAPSVYSGVFTQIFREERGLFQDQVFCFIHLSVQEFLAALHVHWTFISSGVNLMKEQQTSQLSVIVDGKPKLNHLHQSAVNKAKALQSPNGHLDLFLRFLLGLSLQTNQTRIDGLMTQTESSLQTNETVQYIKEKISEDVSAERNINLFHCLNELNDRSLVEEIQQSLRSGRLSRDKLSPAQWSALGFILVSSEKDLDVFDLKKYSASEEVLLRLLPVVRASNKAVLSSCNLSERSCEALSSVLSSQSSSLRVLDLSNNDLKNSRVKILSAGLQSPHCRLETLSLSGCLVSEEGCSSLASALRSNPSYLRELDLSYNHPGEKILSALQEDPLCRLETLRLSSCNLSERSCEALSSVLSSQSSSLRVLDLSNNDLKDSGVKILAAGLQSPHCRLETLSLSGCLVSEEGCSSLASALRSNPSYLRELDLSYNHPGESGEKMLSALQEDPLCRLETLRSNSPEPDSSGASQANAATVKLPDFWQDNPCSWFHLVEAQFALRGITVDDIKFYHVISKLDNRTAQYMQSFLERPPADDKYSGLNVALIQRFTPSVQERAERLLALNDLGDSTPVDLMEDMLRLRGSDGDDFLFTHIFLRTLPLATRATLAGSLLMAQRDFRALAQEAQRILNASRQRAATAAATELGAVAGDDRGPEAAVADPLTTAATRARDRGGDDLCFYHRRFAERARKCIPLCQFRSSGNTEERRGIRPCIDLRAVNKAIIPNKYPLPTVEELTAVFSGAQVFSKLDLCQGYLQVPLHPDSRNLMAFVIHMGVFRYTQVPFGLSSVPSCFQKVMATMLAGLKGVVIYLDDTVVHGALREEHHVRLERVLESLQEHGVTLNGEKCVFTADAVDIVEFQLAGNGLKLLFLNIEAVLRIMDPSSPAQISSFLGMMVSQLHLVDTQENYIMSCLLPLTLTGFETLFPPVLTKSFSDQCVCPCVRCVLVTVNELVVFVSEVSAMDQCEDTEEGVPPSKTPLCGDHESQTKGQRSEQNTRRHHAGPGPGPGPSCVFIKSDCSMEKLTDLKRAASCPELVLQQRPASPGPSCVSMKSDGSMLEHIFFKDGHQSAAKGVNQQSSEVLRGPSVPQHQRHLDSIFMLLEENIVHFVKKELKKMQKVVSADYPGCLESQREDEEVLEGEDEDERRSSRESFLKITLNFLRRMKQQELAERLQSRSCQHKLKSNLKKRFQCVFEGTAKAGKPSLLKQIYTELYITEGGTAEVNDEHEVRQIEAASRKADRPETTIRPEDIFKGSPGREEPIRRVLTKGVAGIGKTVLTQKLTLDWAEDKANQDIYFTFPFTFRELNVLKEKKFSLVELVHHFFTETKEAGICSFDHFQVLFIFDGLDECRLPLDFHKTEILTDVTESTSVDVLLTNLIRGKLLPSAHLWITTRPAAANHIPPQCVGMVTEVRGFTDPQKEEYFRKRFREEEQTSRIISHMKTSRSLHIMCHIPVFCWITATVLEDEMKTREGGELPKTLTEMYIHFLVVQAKVKKVKYEGGAETDPHWNPETREMIESLGKLAFEQLQKGNLIFYESDLTECGIDIRAASVYSGVFTQIFREERGLYQDQVFCFIHLSVQEFLAALHVHLTFINSGVNLMEEQQTSLWSKIFKEKPKLNHLHQNAVNKALQSPNGHLDLFLRFLLGLSLQTNQARIKGLMTQTGSSLQTNQETVQYIKEKIRENVSAERSINLFHCLNELNDRSLVEEIQQSLRSGRLSTDKLSPAQWSALGFILVSSEKDLDVFDLKKYSASEEVLLRLLPVVRASNKAVLSSCNLSERSCEALSSVLSSQSSSLRVLDLSNNDLKDSGVKILAAGLQSPHCRLETLSLSGCLVSEEGYSSLASALRSNPSHLRELDLSYNHPGESGEKILSALQEDPLCRLETLRLSSCNLSERSCEALSSVLSSQSSSLRVLDLSHNSLKDSGVKILAAGLQSPHCRLETLSLSGCLVSEEGCSSLASALRSNPSYLRELDLSYNHPGESGEKILSALQEDPLCRLETLRLSSCNLSERSCEALSSVLSSQSSSLRVLDLSNNVLKDSGVKILAAGLQSPHCRLETLSLSGCLVSEEGCSSLASALRSNPSYLRELDLSYNHPGESGEKILSALQEDPLCRLETLRLSSCNLSERSCEALSSVLSSQSSSLRVLDLSNNVLKDSGVKILAAGLQSPHCRLETLSLSGCLVLEEGCSSLASSLRSNPSYLRELDLSYNRPGESGEKILSALQEDPLCRLETLRLSYCNLSERSCEALSSVLSSQSSSLRVLDLSNNVLKDSGVKILAAGLQSPHCRLETLSLSGCLVLEEGCSSLASALRSNPSYLRELDLSYNRPGESGEKILSALQEDPLCRLETLRLSSCNLSERSCEALSSVLSSQSSSLRVLDLSNNNMKDSGVKILAAGLQSPHCRLETLSLSGCLVSEEGCSSLASALRSNPSYLRELDLSYNRPGESGEKILSALQEDPLCRLETLRLSSCNLSERSCEALSSVLSSQSSSLRVLDLSNNDLKDSGVKILAAGLQSPHCRLETLRLSSCNLSERSCEALSSVLSSQSSSLRVLDLSNNDLKDSGLNILSAGLQSPHCRLETLSLSGCLVSEEGCSSLASALRSNPSYLRELDLSYNHPGESGEKILSALQEDPLCRLETLRVDHGGQQRLKPGVRKYFCQLELDTNSVNRDLKLSDNNRKVTWVMEDQNYPDHPDRFDVWAQLLCRNGLTGRCYWEVERRGDVSISVSYRGIRRKGVSEDCWFGWNNQSWSLICSDDDGYSVLHNNIRTSIFSSSVSTRVGVYVDCPAGLLSFYRVSSDTLIHLHTFNTTFTQPLYPGFRFWSNSSVSLCSL
ncbi:LOW QUALITY PROTEIN: uncharacterized protein KZ484_000022 [Pholidichthys leucotaenia]